jgi:hypothetical protein
MDFRYVILLLLLSHFAFADCVGYTDEFDVRVLDGNLRPIPGADVWITFDRGTSFGEQYFTTEPRQADAQGLVHFKVLNQGTLVRTIDCDIEISGSAGGSTNKTEVKANIHGPIIDLQLSDVYPVKFYVRDQLNAAIENASVTIGNNSGKTNQYGYVKYFYKTGSYDYFASYQIASQAGSLRVDDDVEFAVIFPWYSISIDVTDDYGEPLPATLNILNASFVLQNGHFENNRSYNDIIDYTVSYKGIEKSGTIDANKNPDVDIALDIHAPLFDKITSDTTGRRTKLSIPVKDPGKFPSGLDIQSLQVNYRLEPADATTPWNTALVFTTGFNSFAAEFPELPADSIVQFRIEAKDKAGNKATVDGKFSTLTGTTETNVTQNQTNPQETVEDGQGIPLWVILVGAIVVILAVYLVIRSKSNGMEG